MFRQLSVNALLKSVISVLAASVVIVLALGAWQSWGRVTAATRIAAVSDTLAHVFAALHNVRLDRSMTNREMLLDKPSTSLPQQISAARAAHMPALKAALASLPAIDFPERQSYASRLDQAIKAMATLHEQTAAAIKRPKAERPQTLAQEFMKATNDLLSLLEDLSARLTRQVKLEDGFIDQLLEIKQLAWTSRNASGDISAMLANALSGQPLPPDALVRFTAHETRLQTAWAALEEIAAGLPMPAQFATAMEAAKGAFFAPDYTQLRVQTIKALIAGEKVSIPASEWTTTSVPKQVPLLSAAEVALDAAKAHASAQRDAAVRMLILQGAFLIAAIVMAAGMMFMVSFRVTSPLRLIQDAMLKLAGGDMTAQVSFGARKDEIGALGRAMQTFKESMTEAERLRAEQKEAEARSAVERRSAAEREEAQKREAAEREEAARKAAMRKLADDFEAAVGRIIAAVSAASSELETSAGTLTKTADTTLQLTGVVVAASEEASSNVATVASAAEEMTGSVDEISRQVQESSRIAAQAVGQAEQTDARIAELAQAASRIGDVVKLITAIAEQTNLLALNATIEAARAGEAGKGFAVVAQEVKALASQTAKATEEIASQISNMQMATADSVNAIKEISGTIERISGIASTIAAAVEEQGAATSEIARSVQQAAQGTARVNDNITDVKSGATETGSASAQVLSSARSLSRESNQLKAEVDKFLRTVRAA